MLSTTTDYPQEENKKIILKKTINLLLQQQADDAARKSCSVWQHTEILWEYSGTPQLTNRDHGTVEPLIIS